MLIDQFLDHLILLFQMPRFYSVERDGMIINGG